MNPGDKLGPYEIVEPIGKGGMGAVYRARDTRLGRDVAVKVSDQKFGERFEREARVISSLNHPNICHLYDVGDNYLVMELVEGQTLADRIKQGAIPLEESLAIARQIADALEAAHEKGITHRDLKPGNVMVTEGGSVKVLDFGLAKVAATAPASGGDPELSPTISMAATQAGVILGTAAYMSPEQARGKNVDKRADIWAFGVVLYEMVTGRRLFQGEDLTDTLAGVVKTDPDLSPAPAKVRRLLKKCLEKDPRKRLRDIGDVWGFLDDPAAAPVAASPPRKALLPWAAAAVFGIAAIAAGWGLWRAPQPEDRPLVRLTVDLGDVNLPASVTGGYVILSPDGTRLAYAAVPPSGGEQRLYTRLLSESGATELAGTAPARAPFFSPDGQWIGFATNGKLNKIQVGGGGVVPLADIGQQFSGANWGQDGTIVFGEALARGLVKISDSGGEATVVAPLADGQIAFNKPQILPDGKTLLFTSDNANRPDAIEVIPLAGGERKVVVEAGASGLYLPSGHLIYHSQGTLFAVAFDLDQLETRGPAVPLQNDLAISPVGEAWLSFSRGGTLVYRSGNRDAAGPQNTVQWLDAAGKRSPLIATPGRYTTPRISPDGQRVALRSAGDLRPRIVVYNPQRGDTVPLTFEDGNHHSPIWSPDGRFVVSANNRTILWTRSDGGGQPRTLLGLSQAAGAFNRTPSTFTPDGKRLLFQESGGTGGRGHSDVGDRGERRGTESRRTRAVPRHAVLRRRAEIVSGRPLAGVHVE